MASATGSTMVGAARSKRCDVCEHFPPNSGALGCGHQFCKDCFERFVSGSLDELNKSLRCCVCGGSSVLIAETKHEPVRLCFGREREPKLFEPNGFTMTPNGDFVSFDKLKKRGYLFDQSGNVRLDFAFVYMTSPMDGVAITHDGLIIAPFKDDKHNTHIAYFTTKGSHLTSAFINAQENTTDVTALAVNHLNWVAVSDRANSAIHLLHPARRHAKSIIIDKLNGEVTPRPVGVTFTSSGEVVVTDEANHCIKFYNAEGKFLHKSGRYGEQPGQFKSPQGVSLDSDNRIFVADRGNGRVQILTPEGAFIRYLVRLNQGRDVYLAPKDVICLSVSETAVLLTGTRDAHAAEVRIYTYCLDQF